MSPPPSPLSAPLSIRPLASPSSCPSAPEFYNDLPQCKSWPGTILNYIFNDSISPFSRVIMHPKGDKKRK